MAATRIVIVALLAIVAVQRLDAESTRFQDIDELVKEAMEKAKQTLHALAEEIEALNVKLEDGVAKLIELVTDLETKLANDTTAELAKIKAAVDAEVQKVEAFAQEHGVNITDCIEKEINSTDGVVGSIIAGVTECEAPFIMNAEQLLFDAQTELQKVKKELADGEAALEGCLSQDPLPAVKCIGDQTKTTVAEVLRDSMTITNIVVRVEDLYNDVKTKVPPCAEKQIVVGDLKELTVLKDLALCVASKV